MAGRERVNGAQAKRHGQTRQHHSPAGLTFVQQLRKKISANHRTRRGAHRLGKRGRSRHGERYHQPRETSFHFLHYNGPYELYDGFRFVAPQRRAQVEPQNPH